MKVGILFCWSSAAGICRALLLASAAMHSLRRPWRPKPEMPPVAGRAPVGRHKEKLEQHALDHAPPSR